MQVGVKPLNSKVFFKKLRKPLDAGVNRPVDGSQDAFVLAVRFMVLHDKHQNVVNVDLHLPDELDLEGNIIIKYFLEVFYEKSLSHCLVIALGF